MILFMLGVTGLVLAGVVGFFYRLCRRARLVAQGLIQPAAAAIAGPTGQGMHTPLWHLDHSHGAPKPVGHLFPFLTRGERHRGGPSPRHDA